MKDLLSHSTPLFISFEGIDGCGKSTVMAHFIQWLDEAGIGYIKTREPGGTPLGEKIRTLLLDTEHAGMSRQAEVLLYSASRAQLTQDVILPALKSGTWVLSDRFMDATLAYQGFGRGLDLDLLRTIQEWATGGLRPHRTILLDCDVQVARRRMHGRENARDRIELEELAFHQRVRQGYLALAAAQQDRFLVLDAQKPLPEVLQDLRQAFF